MAWKKGESGNPGGRLKDRPLTDALNWAIKLPINQLTGDKAIKGKNGAQAMALALVREAIESRNTNAYKAAADRLEGTPVQSVQVSNANDGILRLDSYPIEFLEQIHDWVEEELGTRRPALAAPSDDKLNPGDLG